VLLKMQKCCHGYHASFRRTPGMPYFSLYNIPKGCKYTIREQNRPNDHKIYEKCPLQYVHICIPKLMKIKNFGHENLPSGNSNGYQCLCVSYSLCSVVNFYTACIVTRRIGSRFKDLILQRN
jgi:hypothetical protein